ncbi:MAG: hypothetical protein ACYTGL_16330, partial [Planctomycetota bacterium]
GTTITLTGSGAITYGTLESLSIDALGGADTVNVSGSTDYDFTPGAAAGESSLLAGTLPIALTNLGAGETLDLDGTNLTVHGSDANNVFDLDTTDLNVDGGVNITRTNLTTLTLDGLAGDDQFNVTSGHGYTTVNIQGGNPSASDSISVTGSAGADTIGLALNAEQITGVGTINLSGVEHVSIADGGGTDTINVTEVGAPTGINSVDITGSGDEVLNAVGTTGDDNINVTPTGSGTGSFEAGGPTVSYSGIDNSAFTVDGNGGFDVLGVLGSEDADTVTDTASTITSNGGTVTLADIDRADLTLGSGADSVTLDELTTPLVIDAGAGDDSVDASGLTAVSVTVFGGDGEDTILGGEQADELYGDAGDDIITGGMGDDVIYGREGFDQIAGNEGDDAVDGGDGVDVIDWVIGDGFDTVSGGSDASDIMNFFADGSANVISVNGGDQVINISVDGETSAVLGVEFVNIDSGAGGDTIAVGDLHNSEI